MVGVYKQLAHLHKQGSLDFSRVITFNLDEYLGLAAAYPQSFHYFMGKISSPTSILTLPTATFPTEPSAAITINTSRPTKSPSGKPEASTFSFWESGVTAT